MKTFTRRRSLLMLAASLLTGAQVAVQLGQLQRLAAFLAGNGF